MREHSLIDGPNNTYQIKFTSPPFNDILFSIGKVEIIEKSEQAVLSFTYDVIEGTVSNEEEFKQEVGDFLWEMIQDQLTKKTLIYHGGLDE